MIIREPYSQSLQNLTDILCKAYGKEEIDSITSLLVSFLSLSNPQEAFDKWIIEGQKIDDISQEAH